MIEAVSLERRKLFELVAEHIESLILSGKLKPGDQLPPERELQAAFGVGRPAVREALITLEHAGLIEIGNGAPARVSRPSAVGVLAALMPGIRHLLTTDEGKRQFQAVRLLVEIGLVREAARRADDDFVARLGERLAENRAARDEVESFIATDVAFHYTIAEFAGEPAILAIHEAISSWLSEQRVVSLREVGAVERAIDHHARIHAAIAARDPDAAEAAMRAHLVDVQAFYWSHVQEG